MYKVVTLQLVLLLLCIQGYLDFFHITYFHARILTYGVYITFGLLLMIIVINKQSFPVFPLKRLGLMLIFIISIWYLIGLNNNNYSLIFDLKSILLIILTSLIAFISVENPSRVKRIFDFFCKLLVPLALMNMITSIPGINLFNYGWGVGRYGYVFIFGYLYYLVKVLFHNNRDIFAILSLAIFFLVLQFFLFKKQN